MPAPATDAAFLETVPTFAQFGQIADTDSYLALPDGWVLGVADIVHSTRAIEAGRYKTVNMAGAATISAVSNKVGHGAFPFVFGGDGASFAVPPEWENAAREALAATATFVREELDLELRVALVPIAAIRDAGLDVRLARFAASPHVSYAMFSGGGLAWAETQMKTGAFAVAPAPPGTRPDLSGLSCRFDEIPARRGVILSLIVRAMPEADPARYRDVIERVLTLVEASQEMSRPLAVETLPFRWPPTGMRLEAIASLKPGMSRFVNRLRLMALTAFSYLVFRFRIPVGAFEPNLYLADLVANSDYRKYDDGLRMTIDCAPAFADSIEAILVKAEAEGEIQFGLHRQGAALMTCITPSAVQRDHIHFVDGAAGGYAAAASILKGSLA